LSSGNPIIGYVMLKDTSTLFNIFKLTTSRLILPRGLKFELGKMLKNNLYLMIQIFNRRCLKR
jgi:hypothetical protein